MFVPQPVLVAVKSLELPRCVLVTGSSLGLGSAACVRGSALCVIPRLPLRAAPCVFALSARAPRRGPVDPNRLLRTKRMPIGRLPAGAPRFQVRVLREANPLPCFFLPPALPERRRPPHPRGPRYAAYVPITLQPHGLGTNPMLAWGADPMVLAGTCQPGIADGLAESQCFWGCYGILNGSRPAQTDHRPLGRQLARSGGEHLPFQSVRRPTFPLPTRSLGWPRRFYRAISACVPS